MCVHKAATIQITEAMLAAGAEAMFVAPEWPRPDEHDAGRVLAAALRAAGYEVQMPEGLSQEP